MPRQNRVLPTGEIVALPTRGAFMGNRGVLHDAAGRLGASRWRHRHWICCRLAFRGRRRRVMAPGRYTELFFLDEAVALAAGHRPCAECRREAYRTFCTAWAAAFGAPAGAAEIDRQLHADRVRRDRSQVRFAAPAADLPDGAFLRLDGRAMLVAGGALWPFGPDGYGPARALPRGSVEVLTPRATVAVLRAGYRPVLHPGVC